MAKGLFSKLTKPFRGGGAAPKAPPKSRKKVAKKAAPTTPATPKEDQNWSAARLNVVEKMWGEGYITPGGEEQVKKLLPLMDLNNKKSVLLLGPGLGGINLTMVEETGVWITGLERDRELAEIGHASMQRANLKRQAPVRFSTLENLELKTKSFDAALSFEGTIAVADKKTLFASVADSLRIEGEMFFSTLALPDTNPPNDAVKAWIASEPKSATPHPWPIEALKALLVSLNMEVRPVEDMTVDYRRWVMTGFLGFLSNIGKAELLANAQDLMNEAEYWSMRIKAIDSGGLKVVRFHAIKLPDKRKSINELMAKA